jgi:hypothetical protein
MKLAVGFCEIVCHCSIFAMRKEKLKDVQMRGKISPLFCHPIVDFDQHKPPLFQVHITQLP